MILSSDLAFEDFLSKASRAPRHEVVVWTETRLIEHLYDEETERLRPFAAAAPANRATRRKRLAPEYHFTDRQLEIARQSLERSQRAARRTS